MSDITPDQARKIRAQLENLQELLTQPQRVAMLEMVSEFEGGQAGVSDEASEEVRQVAQRIQATFAAMLADAPPSIRERIQRVANARMQRAKLAASVPRRNWYQEYIRRTDRAFAMDNALDFIQNMRAMLVWENPLMPPPGVRGPAMTAELFYARKRADELGL